MNSIEEIQKKRFQFLHKLYELTEGDRSIAFDMYQIGKELDFDEDLTDKITQYLEGEGLIRNELDYLSMSHIGVREVEEALTHPDIPTYYFPPINIISIKQMINSQIQQASPSVTQLITIDEDRYEEVKKIIQSLKESIDQLGLGSQQKSDLQAEIQTIEAQMSSTKPKGTFITECICSIRRILEGVSGSVLAHYLLNQIQTLCGK